LGVLVLLYVGLLLAVARFTLYPYRTPVFFSPGIMGLQQEEVSFPTFDGLTVRAWWINAENAESEKVAILLHGYMMNRSELAPVAVPLSKEGFHCLVIDFPGHGYSPRRKTGLGYVERGDVLAAISYVLERIPEAQIVLIGSSMGAAAAAFAAPEVPPNVRALVLDGAYSRMSTAITGFLHFMGGKGAKSFLGPIGQIGRPMMGLNPAKLSVTESLKKVRIPVLLLHGDRDVLAPPSDAEANLAALGDHGELVWLPKSNHAEGRWLHPDLYHQALFSFLGKVFKEDVAPTNIP
jgi:pimeloyl-ACP methyl ester carboxylesterase